MKRSLLIALWTLATLLLPSPALVTAQAIETPAEELILRVEDGDEFFMYEEPQLDQYIRKNGEAAPGLDPRGAAQFEGLGIESMYVWAADFDHDIEEDVWLVLLRTRVLTFEDNAAAEDYIGQVFDHVVEESEVTEQFTGLAQLERNDLPDIGKDNDTEIVGWSGAEYYSDDMAQPHTRYVARNGNTIGSISVSDDDENVVYSTIDQMFAAQWDCVEDDVACDPLPFPDITRPG